MSPAKEEPTCYGKAIDLLSRRGHFRLELQTKLLRRGFEDDEVAATLDRLHGEGLVDDVQSARQWIGEKLRRGEVGRRRLTHDLMRRGVDHDVCQQLLSELLPEDDGEATHDAAQRWLRRQPPGRDPQLLSAALARHLERRGFSRRAIFGVLRRVRDQGVDGTLDALPYDGDS